MFTITNMLNSIFNMRLFSNGAGNKAKCDAKLPTSPMKEVALTCFGEASNNCAAGNLEKRAITDCVYNRAGLNRSYWCGSNPASVVGCAKNNKKGELIKQFVAYGGKQYNKASNPESLDKKECSKLKDCISATESSSGGTAFDYNGFNQTYKPDRDKICEHYFRTEP